jgi:thioredoxin 1
MIPYTPLAMKDEDDDEYDSIAKKLEAALEGRKEPLANGKLNDLEKPEDLENIRKPSTSVVEFFTTNCPYCRQMTPILEELADEFKSRVYFSKINVDHHQDTREEYSIMGVPEIIVFKKGIEVARVEGLQSYQDLERWIDSIHRGLRPMGMESGLSSKTAKS